MNLNFPRHSLCETGRRKARESLIYKKIVQTQAFVNLTSSSTFFPKVLTLQGLLLLIIEYYMLNY